ncbi:MAG: zf-HC2 domain-containing protein [Candidatus Omnitrophica bacterium]|nr:zf-HC2 domain-containing protein [Candidatus Omnitrophota bacterium]
MNCEEVKAIIPAYINHSASQDETGLVEEHLCICNDCRQSLSQAIDNSPRAPTKEKQPDTNPVNESTIVPKKEKIGVWEYAVLSIGVLVLVFFIFLFIKG